MRTERRMVACLSAVSQTAPPSETERRAMLEREIAELAGHLHAGTAALIELLAEIDELGDFAAEGFVSTAHWLSWRCGFSLSASREKVRVARALRALPALREAFGKGALSFAKVRAVTRIATPDNEDMVLEWARDGTASHLERIVRLYRRQGQDAAESQHARRELKEWREEDGSVVIRLRLPAEQGALVLKAIEAAMAELDEDGDVSAETWSRDTACPGETDLDGQPVDGASTLSACDCHRPGKVNLENEAPDVSAETSLHLVPGDQNPDRPPLEIRRADAFLRVAEAWFRPDKRARGTGERYQVHVHMDLRAGARTPLKDPDAPALSPGTLNRLACEAHRVPVLHGIRGEILSVGRRSRAVPAPIRRALRVRDGGCRFPGCNRHRFVDAHHIRHWADGGETRLSNLVELCRHHHRLVHEGGVRIEGSADRSLVFRRPDGSVIPAAPASTDLGPQPIGAMRQAQAHLAIDGDRCSRGWRGETVDYDLALAALSHEPAGMRSDHNAP